MQKFYLLLLLALGLGLTACEDDHGNEILEITYDTVPFDRIRVQTSSDIRIVQSNFYRVTVYGRNRDLDRTEVSVFGDQLEIEERGNIHPDQLITIYVPSFVELDAIGSSPIYGESLFHQDDHMRISMAGSGDLDFYIDTDDLDIGLYGSGNIFLEGLADHLDIDLTGSGQVRAFGLNSDFTDVRVDGSGDVEVFSDVDLDVIIRGSGDVFYKGHPTVHVEITGSGRVIDAN